MYKGTLTVHFVRAGSDLDTPDTLTILMEIFPVGPIILQSWQVLWYMSTVLHIQSHTA